MKKIFIGGCERSGTTLLGAVLGQYQGCVVTPESQFKTDFLVKYGNVSKIEDEHISYIEKHWRFKLWGFSRENILNIRKESIGKGFNNLIEKIVKEYAAINGVHDVLVWVDHTPENVRKLILIEKNINNSSFVHIVRDPRAVFASVKKLPWGPNTAFFFSKWYGFNLSFGLASELSGKCSRVYYEDLLEGEEKTVAYLERVFGLSLKEKDKGLNSFVLPGYTVKQHSLIRSGKIVKKSKEAWRDKLKDNELSVISLQLGSLAQCLGYKVECHPVNCKSNKVISMISEIFLCGKNMVKFNFNVIRHTVLMREK